MKKLFKFILIIAFVTVLAGCGQNGPLFMPDQTMPTTTGDTP